MKLRFFKKTWFTENQGLLKKIATVGALTLFILAGGSQIALAAGGAEPKLKWWQRDPRGPLSSFLLQFGYSFVLAGDSSLIGFCCLILSCTIDYCSGGKL